MSDVQIQVIPEFRVVHESIRNGGVFVVRKLDGTYDVRLRVSNGSDRILRDRFWGGVNAVSWARKWLNGEEVECPKCSGVGTIRRLAR